VALLVCLALVGGPVRALEPSLDSLKAGERGRVAAVVDGDTVMLDGGLEVRLVGLQAPKLALGRAGFEPWPLAEEAKASLEEIALGRAVELRYGGRQRDRHGRALAHLIVEGEAWAQGLMLERGMARVYSFADNRGLVTEMLRLEAAARDARRGIWSHPFYAVLTPEQAAERIDDFALVEGQVLSVGGSSSRTYLNFGADFRTDFTVSVTGRDRRAFAAAGLDLKGLEGHIIRVRGWLDSINGPMVEATHPEQIELVQ
jgi:endonuclease YncB( thermonuclease family)